MYSVLFICTGNQFRSPIAAETFRMMVARDGKQSNWFVNSAGTWTTPGRPIPREAIVYAREFGVNIENHQTSLLDQGLLQAADLALVMESGHKEAIQVEFPFARRKTFMLSQVLEGVSYDIPDPASARNESREIIKNLIVAVQTGYRNICALAEQKSA